MSMLSIAFSLFLLMDSIGNIPLYISFLKEVGPRRQYYVIFREMIIALGIIIIFNFIGDGLMNFLHIRNDTLQIAGGIILFLIGLKMIFPSIHNHDEKMPRDKEPFIVPLAVPLIAGPSVLAAVIIYSQQTSVIEMVGAILIAWFISLSVLLSSIFLKRLLGWRGIFALEKLMGLILILIAVQMFMNGLAFFAGL